MIELFLIVRYIGGGVAVAVDVAVAVAVDVAVAVAVAVAVDVSGLFCLVLFIHLKKTRQVTVRLLDRSYH